MGNRKISLDSQNASPKEIIRRNIRHALSSKSNLKYPNIDITSELFPEIQNPLDTFIKQFRKSGGKFVPCDIAQFNDYLIKLLKSQRYNSVFCAEHSLGRLLADNDISYSNTLLPNIPADAAIIYSDLLIARSGSIVFTQKYQLYPSIKGIAKDIIVVAKHQNIINSLKDALSVQMDRNGKQKLPFYEIVTPTLPETTKVENGYSPENPRCILFMVY